ncbi:MAG: DUF4215 domain-containing protein [Myxococcota bacterium]
MGTAGTPATPDPSTGDGDPGQDDDGDSSDSGDDPPPPPPTTCGDGVLDPGEECDHGEANGPGQQCKNNCELNTCGDADVGPNETCDDGNQASGDGCSASCLSESCGNDITDTTEQCDDGANGNDDDGCTDTCTIPTCGDGIVQESLGEECEDGNASNEDACVQGCVSASCGDGFVWAGQEECDDDNTADDDACLSTCVPASCGDGFVWTGMEDCDPGAAEVVGCQPTCQAQIGYECTGNVCEVACGDGLIVGNECCDDGNTDDGDGCPGTCQYPGWQRIVFVTEDTFDGNMGGIAGADALCQDAATAVGLPGTFRAWLSDDTHSPDADWTRGQCDDSYVLTNGQSVAGDWNDLTDGNIDEPIRRTEAGNEVGGNQNVWTGTDTDGTLDNPGRDCEEWSSTNADGRSGMAGQSDHDWTDDWTRYCGNFQRLYCFEQVPGTVP